MDKKTQQTKKKKTDTQKEKKTNKGQTVERDHREIIFASLYTTIKNKMVHINAIALE